MYTFLRNDLKMYTWAKFTACSISFQDLLVNIFLIYREIIVIIIVYIIYVSVCVCIVSIFCSVSVFI